MISKNRHAMELMDQARQLEGKIADPNVQLSAGEVQQMLDGIKSLKARADAIAGFDKPEVEAKKHGLEKIDSNEQAEKVFKSKTMQDDVNELNAEIVKAFGSMGGYVRALNGKDGKFTSEQERVLKSAKNITKTIIGDTTTGGEYVLPLQQAENIFRLSNVQAGVLQNSAMYNAVGRTLRIPYLIQDTGSVTRPGAGIANVGIIGEGSLKDTREPMLGQRQLTVYKYAAISQFGDELLEDDYTGQLPTALVDAVGQQAINAFNEDITIDGSGTSEPLGALHANNGALYSVTRTVSGSVGLGAADMLEMYSRHVHGPKSQWLVSRAAFKNVMNLAAASSSLVTYLPNLNVNPYGLTLLGIPVVVTDLLPSAGTAGDIALVNGDFYATAVRKALTVDSSIHVAFTSDVTTYRFIFRAGGIPLPTSTYSYKASGGTKTYEVSPFVTLTSL